MATAPLTPPIAEEDYLRIERQAQSKSEYFDGQVFAMAGGTSNHSLLSTETIFLLRQKAPRGCRVFNSDMRIKVEGPVLYTYSDVAVVCGDLKLATDQKDCLLNPVLIVEVLSPSTESYDRGKKFELYRAISSFREYLTVHQDRRHVEHWSKQDDGSWVLREYSGSGATVKIARWDVELPLDEIYATAVDIG